MTIEIHCKDDTTGFKMFFDYAKSCFVMDDWQKHLPGFSGAQSLCNLLNSEIDTHLISWGENAATKEYFALLNDKPFIRIQNNKLREMVLYKATELSPYICEPFVLRNLEALYAINLTKLKWHGNDKIHTLYVPNCETFLDMAMHSAKNLQECYAPKCKFIHGGAFGNTPQLKSFTAENLETIGQDSFNMTGLETFKAPKLKSIGDKAFEHTPDLQTFLAPACENIGSNVLYYTPKLETVCFDKLVEIYNANQKNASIMQFVTKGVNIINRIGGPVLLKTFRNDIKSADQFKQLIDSMRQH